MYNTKETKELIATSFYKLACTTPINKISIKSIVKECGLNRQTFYYHFKDIYDLIEWIYKHIALKELLEDKLYENWEEGFLELFVYMRKHKTFLLNVTHTADPMYLKNFVHQVTNQLLKNIIDKYSMNLEVTETQKMDLATFYAPAFIDVCFNWVFHGMKEEPVTIIQKISIIMEGNFMNALYRYQAINQK